MSHTIVVSDETYETLVSVATPLGQTPEGLIEAWATNVPASGGARSGPGVVLDAALAGDGARG